MLTGDKKLDELNDALTVALKAWQAEANAATAEALTQATAAKANYLLTFNETARTEYMRKFIAHL